MKSRKEQVLIFILLIAIVAIGAFIYNSTKTTVGTPNQTITTAPEPTTDLNSQIVISNLTAKPLDSGYYQAIGEVKNLDSTKHSVSITVTFYDANNKILGTAPAFAENIQYNETKTFTAVSTSNVTGYKSIKAQVDSVY